MNALDFAMDLIHRAAQAGYVDGSKQPWEGKKRWLEISEEIRERVQADNNTRVRDRGAAVSEVKDLTDFIDVAIMFSERHKTMTVSWKYSTRSSTDHRWSTHNMVLADMKDLAKNYKGEPVLVAIGVMDKLPEGQGITDWELFRHFLDLELGDTFDLGAAILNEEYPLTDRLLAGVGVCIDIALEQGDQNAFSKYSLFKAELMKEA